METLRVYNKKNHLTLPPPPAFLGKEVAKPDDNFVILERSQVKIMVIPQGFDSYAYLLL